jgi:2'-phosphotransferase
MAAAAGGTRNKRELTDFSRALTLVLRHKAAENGIELDKRGFAPAEAVLGCKAVLRRKKRDSPAFNVFDLCCCAVESEKQRFGLELRRGDAVSDGSGGGDGTDGAELIDLLACGGAEGLFAVVGERTKNGESLFIRANQGHSVALPDLDLERITVETLAQHPREIVHGTTAENWAKIQRAGFLSRMGRNHIHFAPVLDAPNESASAEASSTQDSEAKTEDEPAQALHAAYERARVNQTDPNAKEKPGIRHYTPIGVFVDLHAAVRAGCAFFISDNGVVLAPDDVPILGGHVLRVAEIASGEVVTGWDDPSKQVGPEPQKQHQHQQQQQRGQQNKKQRGRQGGNRAPGGPEAQRRRVDAEGGGAGSAPNARQIAAARKKVRQIESLKDLQAKGKELNADQLAKLGREAELIEEIRRLEAEAATADAESVQKKD